MREVEVMVGTRTGRCLGDARGAIAAGLVALALVFGGFGVWASTAPLAGAVVAPGIVATEANRQAVQHPDGGTVAEILVRPGEQVEQGQILIRLDATAIRAEIDMLTERQAALAVQAARLVAERDGADAIAYAGRATELLAGQVAIFEARKRAHAGETSGLRQKVAQLREQIGGLAAQRASITEQKRLIADELAGVRELFNRGYTTKPRLLALERRMADLEGERGEIIAKTGQANEAIAETEIRIEQRSRDRMQEIATELQSVNAELAQINPRLAEARVRLGRTELRAPRPGEVVDLHAFTVGGVLKAGERVLDIVPSDTPLIVEARVQALDIENVATRMPARVRLVAYRAPEVPVVGGTVTRVSADRVVAGEKMTAGYAMTVELDGAARSDLKPLRVGMPVEVIVPTANRTLLDYLAAPLSNSFARAMRED